MIYPANYEEKTGFDRVRAMLSGNCLSELGRSYVDRMDFQTDFQLIDKLLRQVHEFKQILEFNEGFPSTAYHDLRAELNRLLVPGTYSEPEILVLLLESLRTIFACRTYLQKRSDRFPMLLRLGSLVETDPSVVKEIERIIDQEGEIRDNASAELKDIRKQIHRQKQIIDRALDSLLAEARRAGYTTSDAEVTIRNGRWVIPVLAQHKRRFKGIVHDESNTGQTLFIEPEQVFEASNYLLELQYAERREIVKILTEFSTRLRPNIPTLLSAYRFLGLIDFIRAKAILAQKMHAVMPSLSDQPEIDWKEAVHPLLAMNLQKQNKHIVTNSFLLNEKQRILVISGPNAGGKSVYLKTAGLLQYMLQCGLLIPLREDSKAGVFAHLFVDIGDEQSLENDLSTYSSHLLNIKTLLETAGNGSLFLIDEFGSGTEPQTGGAIAESVLEILAETGALGIVTTHYANLKLLAARLPGLMNAAMMYDTQQMKPIFKLRTGKPGSSFAFEIASTTGLEEKILLRAAELAGKTQLDYDKELIQLDIEMESLRKKESEFKMADDFLNEVVEKYQKLHKELADQKKEIIVEAQAEAKAILEKSNKLIENTIQKIVEVNAEKAKTREIRRGFTEEKQKLLSVKQEAAVGLPTHQANSPLTGTAALQEPATAEPLKTGDRVKITGNTMTGEILELYDDEAVIGFGSFTLRTTLTKIIRADGSFPQPAGKTSTSIQMSLPQRMALFQSTLDVRGKRVQEALGMLQSFIDEALLLSVREVRILHGTGTGVLRQVLREELKKMPEVCALADEKPERGGSGISIITLTN